jgi:preprotein translocase subunit SecA
MFQRDKKYVVQDGQVIIVDDFTGRLMPGRRYSEGLHEAIEAKEGVQVRRENVTVATITLQNYFRLYSKLAGMTGTAMTDSEEFHDMYELEVTPLPTNVDYIVSHGEMGLEERRRKVDGAEQVYYVNPNDPDAMVFSKRVDFPDQVYGTKQAKDQAIIEEIKQVLEIGRPILVGTTSVEHSEKIHNLLQKQKIDHSVLNAKLHQSEALTVAQAGRMRGLTISTNMAGRGTDILLGGNPEGLSSEALEKELFDRQDLTQLAHRFLTEGTKEAQAYAQKHPKLTADLVGALENEKAEFDSALSEIEEIQVIGYLAKSLQEPYDIDFNQARSVLRLVRGGQLTAARELLADIDKDVAMVDDAVRLTDLFTRYQVAAPDPRKAASFLSETLFDKLYNGRAALIRALISEDRDEAERLVRIIPGFMPEIIDHVDEIIQQTERERNEIQNLGGLHVIGSERHESRRIDNQLRGRAARQGDQGSSRFFLSLEDDLMMRFGGERLRNFMARTNVPDDMPIESGLLDRIIESSQERIEGYNFDIRKNVVEYDDVMSQQRTAIYNQRRSILQSEDIDLDSQIGSSFEQSIDELIDNYLENYPGYVSGEIDRAVTDFSTDATDSINVNGVLVRMRALLPGVINLDRGELADVDAEELTEMLMNLTYENLEEGTNLYQFLQAASRFIPLLPLVPNLGALLSQRPSGQLKLRAKVQVQFVSEVERVFNGFLAENIDERDKETIWNRTVDQLGDAFAQFNVEGLSKQAIVKQQVGFRQKVGSILRDLLIDSLSSLDNDQLAGSLTNYVHTQQEIWRKNIGEDEFRNFQRLLLLDAIDREWRDYLVAMDDLRREIGLEAFAQRDPKVEYKRRSFQMFADMRTNIDRAIAESYFHRIARHQAFIRQQEASVAYQEQLSQAGYQVVKKEKGRGVELRRDTPKVGRNDPCPCGSGKKYKQCHLRQDLSQAKKEGSKGRVRS